jgi:uroporphyrinogen decarboxylase
MSQVEKLLWEPAVYEHKAALIGRPVAEVAASAYLLAAAMEAEYEEYRADFLTVGLDVYNVEAEACGAVVVPGEAGNCPEILSPPWRIDSLPRDLPLPSVPGSGRFAMILEAAAKVVARLGLLCCIRVAASGPVSIAAKLVGLEDLIIAMADGNESARRLLRFTTALAEAWCRCLRENGLDAIVFDSAAVPPVFSPPLYADAVAPLHRRIMSLLAGAGQAKRPLIVGGDSVPILPHLARCGANMLICDFTAEAEIFAAALPAGRDLLVRRNVHPGLFISPSSDALSVAAGQLCRDLRCFSRPVAGTGILPYQAAPKAFQDFRRMVEEQWK